MADRRKESKGRRPMLNKTISKKIEQALRAGNYKQTAAKYAGISLGTFYGWMQRGRNFEQNDGPKEDAIYFEFLKMVEKAMADAEVEDVAIIKNASRKQWQAAAWMLERKFPDRWGRRDHVELTGKDGGPVEISAREKVEKQIEAMTRSTRSADDDFEGDEE